MILEEKFLLMWMSCKNYKVWRKTANVVASVLYDIPTMPVDTHVFRVSERGWPYTEC